MSLICWDGFRVNLLFFGLVGVDISMGSLPRAIDVDEDFGSFGGLQDLTNMDGILQHNPTLDPKGKGKEVVNTDVGAAALPILISDVTRGQLGTLTQNALDSLLGMKGIGPLNDSGPLFYAETSSLTNTTSAASSSRSARQQRQEDIIKRAKERRVEIQEDLDVIKRRLWETTVEKAGLLLIASGQGEERENVLSSRFFSPYA